MSEEAYMQYVMARMRARTRQDAIMRRNKLLQMKLIGAVLLVGGIAAAALTNEGMFLLFAVFGLVGVFDNGK